MSRTVEKARKIRAAGGRTSNAETARKRSLTSAIGTPGFGAPPLSGIRARKAMKMKVAQAALAEKFAKFKLSNARELRQPRTSDAPEKSLADGVCLSFDPSSVPVFTGFTHTPEEGQSMARRGAHTELPEFRLYRKEKVGS
jgi:hypothetical protein